MTQNKIPVAQFFSKVKDALKQASLNNKKPLIDIDDFEKTLVSNIEKQVISKSSLDKIIESDAFKMTVHAYRNLTPEMYVAALLDYEFKHLNCNEITLIEFNRVWSKIEDFLNNVNNQRKIDLDPSIIVHMTTPTFLSHGNPTGILNKKFKKWLSI